MNKQLLKKNYFIFFALLAGFPLFFIPNNWDGTIFAYGFLTENIGGIETWYKESSSNFQLMIVYILFFFKKLLNIHHEILFDFFTIATLILFSFEVKKYSEIFFLLENKWSNFCAIITCTFPVWHALSSFNLALYLFCFYLALFGFRLSFSRKIMEKITGIFLILFSFSIKSNFSFVIGLSTAYIFNRYFDKKYKKSNYLFVIVLLSLSAYFFNNTFFPPYGIYEGYNQLDFRSINILEIIKNTYDYLTFFFFFLWIPILCILLAKFTKKKSLIKKIIFDRNYLFILIIFLASIAPYVLVGKSSDLLFFSDHVSRHAFLISVSFSLFFSIIFKNLSKSSISKKLISFSMTLVTLQNLFLLSLGQYDKIESAIFKHNFVSKLKNIDKLPEGNVLILSKNKIIYRPYEINYLFFQAYGKAAWWGEFTNDINKNKANPPENILNNDYYRLQYVVNNYQKKCNTKLKIYNEISRLERIKKFYIFNSKNYNQIKIISSDC